MFSILFSTALLLPLHITRAHGAPVYQNTTQNASCSLNSYELVQDNGTGIWPYRQYKSSNITTPSFNITQNGEELSPGAIFMGVGNAGSVPGEEQIGALIMTSDGDMVWGGPDMDVSNVRKQTLNGKSVMSYWKGSGSAAAGAQAGHGFGMVEVIDSSYNSLYTVCPKIQITQPPGQNSSCVADVHESYITPSNTM